MRALRPFQLLAPAVVVIAALASAGLWAAPPQLAAAAGVQAARDQTPARKYSGSPISMDLQGADLRAVLRSLAEISGLNMVIDPAVKGSVDIKLTDVPWDQALEMVLKSNKLGYVLDETVVRIMPLAALAEEEAARKQLTDAQALAGTTEIQTFALSYAEAGKLAPLLTKAVLSSRGQIQVDDRSNTLVISDLPARLAAAADLIKSLDRAQPQVEIEARIVQTNHDTARELGVQWGLNGTATMGNTTVQTPQQPQDSNRVINLPVATPTTTLGLAVSALGGKLGLDLALSALEKSGKGRILSTPKVTTQNNQPAEVMQGVQIPIQVVQNNTVTVTFKDAALSLKVTPQITAVGTVIMRIELENATPDFTRAVNNIPPIDTQRAVTQVQVQDGATTVIGGIVVSTQQSQSDRTPGLSQIPLLGWLFRHDQNKETSTELLIFITPHIIRGTP
jgi:type IV pilus assembly protein PilQ